MPMDAIILESCNSTWIIDTQRLRFRRILKDVEVSAHRVTTEWRPYCQIVFDEHGESFTVTLTPDGTRRIRSWRHRADCAQCGGHITTEFSLDELREAVNS